MIASISLSKLIFIHLVGKDVLPSPTDNILLCCSIPLVLSNATVQIPTAINNLTLFLPIAFSTTEKVMIDENSVVAVGLHLEVGGINYYIVLTASVQKECIQKRSHGMKTNFRVLVLLRHCLMTK